MTSDRKVVLITGASGGIGAACALEFAKTAKLSLVGRNVDNLNNVAKQCEEISGNNPLTIIADISEEENIKRIIKETINFYGKIDVLVNNAGILLMAGIMDDIIAFDKMMATNVRGPYMLTQQAIPYLIESKGNIVNVSSILSTNPLPNMTPYCMTKASIDIMTKCIAQELASKGVRVNAVNPGPVSTELFTRGGISEDINAQLLAGMESALPLKKLVNKEDVAKLVCFLASDDAGCVTGCCYVIDSGVHLGNPAVPF